MTVDRLHMNRTCHDRSVWLLGLTGRWLIGRLGRHRATILAGVEYARLVLKPIQISGQLLCNVTLSASGKADHYDNQFGAHIVPLFIAPTACPLLRQTWNIDRRTALAGTCIRKLI
jgi:hypothetical protein